MNNNSTGFPSKDKTHLKNVSKKLLKPTVLPLSFYGTFMLLNSKRLSEPAVQQGDRIYSKQELRDDTVTLIKAFKEYGVNRGQRLAVITPNFYEGIAMTLAANAAGIQLVYFNPLATDEELAADIDKYTPDLLFVYGRSRESVQKIYALASSKFTMVIDYEPDENPQASDSGSAESAFKYIIFSAFRERGEKSTKGVKLTVLRNLLSKKVSLFLQTSGSSAGKPKGLPFTMRRYLLLCCMRQIPAI